ncbi:MAG: methyltransferase domain-containing protein [Vulcanimicrobiota bacterium]
MQTLQMRTYFEGFWATWLLHVGRELRLFEGLREQTLRPEELAENLGYEPAYTRVWCQAARSFEFLSGDEQEGYRLSESCAEWLPRTGAWATTYVRVSQRVFESMGAVFEGKAFPEPNLSLRMLLRDGLHTSYQWLWNELVQQVPQLLEKLTAGGRLIEFGCGTGCGLELLREYYPELELTGIELDYECAREAERATKAVIVVGSAEESRYENRFDLAVFHRSLSECENPERAVARAAACLRPGGLLVISSEAEVHESGDSASRLRMGERFFYHMFLAAGALNSLTMDQIRQWCREAGLEEVAFFPRSDHGSPTVICARA